MARGIGGDDGPSVWMFLCCVLVFGWVKTQLKSAKDSVSDVLELGKNSGGPLQTETTKDISTMEDLVASWPVSWSTLPKAKSHYQNIADKLWAETWSKVNIDEQLMIDLCKPLSKNELYAVAKCFGVRDHNNGPFTVWTGHIFKAFELALDGAFKGNEMAQMKKIWAVTKLW